MSFQILPKIINEGGGAGRVFDSEDANRQIYLKSVLSGTGIAVSNLGTEIRVANSLPENTTVLNVGSGAGEVYKSKTIDQINLKTLLSGAGISIINNVSDITIAVSGRSFCIEVADSGTSVVVADGKDAFVIPVIVNGNTLSRVDAAVYVKGVTGSTTLQIRRSRAGVDSDMLNNALSIGNVFYASSVDVVAGAGGQVASGDMIFIDVDTKHTTAPLGLSVTLTLVL